LRGVVLVGETHQLVVLARQPNALELDVVRVSVHKLILALQPVEKADQLGDAVAELLDDAHVLAFGPGTVHVADAETLPGDDDDGIQRAGRGQRCF